MILAYLPKENRLLKNAAIAAKSWAKKPPPLLELELELLEELLEELALVMKEQPSMNVTITRTYL